MNMRCAWCSLVCAGLLAGAVFGQPPGGGRGMGGGMGGGLTGLVKSKDVVADAKITEDQVKKLEELDKKMSEKRRTAMQEAQGDRDAMMSAMQEIGKETEKGLSEIVSADQLKRLKQLQLQASIKNGGMLMATMSPDVSKAMAFSEEQQEQLKGFREDMQTIMQEMRQGGGDPAESRKKITEYRTSVDVKINKMLTDEQKKKLKELQGDEFKGAFPAAPAGGNRRGPGKNG